jgi:hypothetical protein
LVTAKVALKRMAGPGVRKAVGGAVGKVKDIAAKVAPKLPGIGKAALGLGAAGLAGYVGGKLAGAGADKKTGAQTGTSGPQTVAAAGGKGGRVTVGKEYDAVLGGKKGKVTYSQSGEKFFKQTEKGAPAAPSTPSGSGSGAAGAKTQPAKPQKPTKPTSQLSPGGRKGNENLEGKLLQQEKPKVELNMR